MTAQIIDFLPYLHKPKFASEYSDLVLKQMLEQLRKNLIIPRRAEVIAISASRQRISSEDLPDSLDAVRRLTQAWWLEQHIEFKSIVFQVDNRAKRRDKRPSHSDYVLQAKAGPVKHGDRNAKQLVKTIKLHPLLKALVQQTE